MHNYVPLIITVPMGFMVICQAWLTRAWVRRNWPMTFGCRTVICSMGMFKLAFGQATICITMVNGVLLTRGVILGVSTASQVLIMFVVFTVSSVFYFKFITSFNLLCQDAPDMSYHFCEGDWYQEDTNKAMSTCYGWTTNYHYHHLVLNDTGSYGRYQVRYQ